MQGGQQDLPSFVFTISLSLSLSWLVRVTTFGDSVPRAGLCLFSHSRLPVSRHRSKYTHIYPQNSAGSRYLLPHGLCSRKRVFVVIIQVIVVADRVLFRLSGWWKRGWPFLNWCPRIGIEIGKPAYRKFLKPKQVSVFVLGAETMSSDALRCMTPPNGSCEVSLAILQSSSAHAR